jgi:hypothetical protein
MPHHHRPTAHVLGALCSILALGCLAGPTWATADFVYHGAGDPVYGEAGVTMRMPVNPTAGMGPTVWVQVGYSFYYDEVALYYTVDGSTPAGAFGVGTGTTAALTFGGGDISFVRNEPHSPDSIDWWRVELPMLPAGTEVKYKLSVWHTSGGSEVFANNAGCADEVCDDPAAPQAVFSYVVGTGMGGVPWPGQGAGYPDPGVGYPPVSFWKEEGVVGNNYMNVMVDQNGTVYDVYYPSAGCVQGMGTKNEGYVDGLDTFPAGLPPGHRGQMNVNQLMGGMRVDGVTYWLSNENAVGYSNVSQQYVPDTNVIETSATLTAGGNQIQVSQYDFCPKGIVFPQDQGGEANRGIYVKRYLLTNLGASAKTVQFYYYADFALNGGDNYDEMFADAGRGALVAYDRTQRNTSSSGEYNPTSFGDYTKDVSVYLSAALKVLDTVGGATGTPATASWRSLGSGDNDQGWIGVEVVLPVGVTKEINVVVAGGFDDFAGATGTYDYAVAPVLDWFHGTSMATLQQATETYWQDWLADGVTVDTPDDRVDEVLRRGLLATALHLDGENGGIIAGMHNGAYPFVWPRDAAWAAITLARAGHVDEAREIYRFLRDVAYRDNEAGGAPFFGAKGFWKQKYTTDGYTVWNAPQVDETSCYPWGVRFVYDVTGDVTFLDDHYAEVWQAAIASSHDSTFDSRLRYEDAFDLIYSNNLWEDQWDTFVYSNASVIRGLEDAAAIATVLDEEVCPGGPGTCNYHNDAAQFTGLANAIRGGLDARLAWNGETTDISQLGIAYPFETYPYGHARPELIMDRINGVAADTFGNVQPLVNSGGEWDGLINRYWGDGYWHNPGGPNPNASPWFLTTLWYGAYYAQRQDVTPGTGDIDNHLYRLERVLDQLGPIGLGAEQMAPSNSLLYPGEMDFVLQAAWPNAWESMSFPGGCGDAAGRLYAGRGGECAARGAEAAERDGSYMTFENLRLGAHRVDLTVGRSTIPRRQHTFVNRTGAALDFETWLRGPDGCNTLTVMVDGSPVPYVYDSTTGRVGRGWCAEYRGGCGDGGGGGSSCGPAGSWTATVNCRPSRTSTCSGSAGMARTGRTYGCLIPLVFDRIDRGAGTGMGTCEDYRDHRRLCW